MKPIWKGHLRFHMVAIPVNLYKAEDTSGDISFNQLHEKDFGRIGYIKRCKKCGQEVSNDEIVKGYEYEDDQYVVIEQEDIDKLKLKSTKVIEIEGFVDAEEVHPMLYEEPYYGGPEGNVAAKSYALFREALLKSGKLAVGRVVLHSRERFVAISPHEDGIVMYRLRLPQDIKSVDEVPGLKEVPAVSKKELDLTLKLFEEMVMPFSELEFSDRYQEGLRALVEAKAKGKKFVTAEEEEPATMDLMSALQASITAAQKVREPVRKTGADRRPAARHKKKVVK
jgi:DNA end-binding protein Ku